MQRDGALARGAPFTPAPATARGTCLRPLTDVAHMQSGVSVGAGPMGAMAVANILGTVETKRRPKKSALQ